jgi:hypothetical protein
MSIINFYGCLIVVAIAVVCAIILLPPFITHSKENQYPTYSETCQPYQFIRKFDYYNDRTFIVCGDDKTEPFVREYFPRN